MQNFLDEFKYSWSNFSRTFKLFIYGVAAILLIVLWNSIF